MRLVLDTNVVVSALLWRGLPRSLLHDAYAGRVTLFTSVPLLLELGSILARRKFAIKIEASKLTIEQLVDYYAELTTVVRPVPVNGVAPDPDDDVVLGTALAAGAGWVVTGDKPLLSVLDYREVQIITVADAVKLLTPS